MSYRLRLLLYTLIALAVADGLISKFLVKNGLGREGNPFLEMWIGSENFLFLKTAGIILASLLLWHIGKRNLKIATLATSSFVVFYTVIIFWNIFMYFTA